MTNSTGNPPSLRDLLLLVSAQDENERSIVRLAARMSISPQTIHRNWLGKNRIPVTQYRQLAAIAGGRVCEEDLLPFVLNR